MPDRIVSFSMSLNDPKPGFQGHSILTSRISQNRCVVGTKLLKNTNRKPYTIYLMVPLSMTLSDRISRSRHFLKSNIGEMARLKDKVTIDL